MCSFLDSSWLGPEVELGRVLMGLGLGHVRLELPYGLE